jgi:hypothetical protein
MIMILTVILLNLDMRKKIKNFLVFISSGDFFKDMVLGDSTKINIAIFGEVLEHLDNPLEVITNFVNNKTKYIFTSSYPFRNDDPNDDYIEIPIIASNKTS